jgi:hypothetical protein
MPPSSRPLTIPEIGALLSVSSGLTIETAADEAGLTAEQVTDVVARVNSGSATTTRGRTRR